MNKSEKTVVKNVIRRLKCRESKKHTAAFGTPRYGEGANIRYMLTGSVDPDRILSDADQEDALSDLPEPFRKDARRELNGYTARLMPRVYLNTWVIGALECLLDEEDGGSGRDLKLAVSLSS